MGLDWTPDQVKIYNLFAEGKIHKEIVASGFDKGLVSKVNKEIRSGGSPPERKLVTTAPSKPKITGEEGEEILNQVAGFQSEEDALLFIFDPRTKKVRQFRHKYPEAVPLYNSCCAAPINYKGSFDEWLWSMCLTLIKHMGWEFKLAPRSQGLIYNDVLRLIEEGLLSLDVDGDGNPKLEVINGNGNKRGSKGGEDQGEGERGECDDSGETGEHREGPARAARAKTNTRSTKRGKKQPAATKR